MNPIRRNIPKGTGEVMEGRVVAEHLPFSCHPNDPVTRISILFETMQTEHLSQHLRPDGNLLSFVMDTHSLEIGLDVPHFASEFLKWHIVPA
jgi:hypothetical protein